MTRIVAVTSGKGGVGKTHLSANLALHCARRGQRVCLFDADLGLANLNLLFKLQPSRTLADVVAGDCRLEDIVLESCGVDIIPGSSGVAGMADLAPAALARLGGEFAALARYDLVFFDTSSGVAGNVLAFVAAAPESLLVITPEPTALTDAYAMVKVLRRDGYAGNLQVVVNQAASERQASHTYDKFREVVRVYQGFELPLLGAVPADPRVAEAVRSQMPVSLFDPDTAAAVAFGRLADRLLALAPVAGDPLDEVCTFWSRLTGTRPAVAAAPAATPAAIAEAPPTVVSAAPAPADDLAERLARLETGFATVVQELLRLRGPSTASSAAEASAPVSGLASVPASQPARTVEAPVELRAEPTADRRVSRRIGDDTPPSRFVRSAQRATPIDALQLRRVVGRMLVKAIPAEASAGDHPLRVAVDQIQLEAGNDFNLRAGRYTRVSLHCHHIESPDGFIEEIFANCAISGCKVRHLGSHVRYWVTSGRDGCILLDGDDGDRNCVQVYMAAGGNNLLDEGAAQPEAVASLRRVADGRDGEPVPASLLAKFPHERVPVVDAVGEETQAYRVLRRDRAPLLCVFHSAGDAVAAGRLREPSPERAS